LLTLLWGCSLFPESTRRRELRESLQNGTKLFIRGDYDGSLKAYQRVLALVQDQPPADVAAYNIGLLYAYPRNPKNDHQKAIGSFNQVISRFPESPWVEQAKVWVSVLNEVEDSKQEVEKTKRAIEKSREDVEKNRLAVEKSKQEIEKTRSELEKSKQEIEKGKQLIEKFKQVDIEIERKRRERGR
jgi:DNA repair exonuclease SbcCD ATPase subunit